MSRRYSPSPSFVTTESFFSILFNSLNSISCYTLESQDSTIILRLDGSSICSYGESILANPLLCYGVWSQFIEEGSTQFICARTREREMKCWDSQRGEREHNSKYSTNLANRYIAKLALRYLCVILITYN